MEQNSPQEFINNLTPEEINRLAEESQRFLFEEKKKEPTESLNSQQKETPSESTTQPPAKKRGSVVSKEQKPGRPLVSSAGKSTKKEEGAPIGGFTQQLKEQKKRQKEYLQELSTKPMDRPKLKAVIEAENRMRNISFDETGKVKVKPVELPKINFNDPMVFSDFDNLQEVDNQLTKIKGIGIKKVKVGEMEFNANINTVKQFREQEKQWYKSAISKAGNIVINKDDVAFIENEYNSQLRREGVVDEAEDFMRRATNSISFKFSGESAVSPVGDNFSDIRIELEKEDPKFKNLKNEQKEELIKKRFFEKKQDAIILNKYYEVAENLTPQERFAITKHSRNLLKATELENKKELDKITAISVSMEKLLSDRDAIEQKAKTIKDREEFESLKSEYESIQLKLGGYYNDLEKTRKKYYESSGKIKNLTLAVQGYSAETSELFDIAKRVKASGIGFLKNMYRLGAELGKELPFLGEEKQQRDIEKTIDILSEYEEKTRSGLRKTDVVNSPSAFLRQTMEVVGDNTFMVAGLSLGTPGLIGMTLDSVGAQIGAINNEKIEFNRLKEEAKDSGKENFFFNGKDYSVKEYENKELYGKAESWVSALGYGAAMNFPLGFQAATIFQKRLVQSVAPSILKKSIGEVIVNNTTKFVKDGLKLDAIITGTNILNKLNDKYILGKDVNMSDVYGGIDQTYHSLLIHGMNASTGYFIRQVGGETSPYLSDKERALLTKNSERAKQISVELNNETLSAEAKQILRNEADILEKQSKSVVEQGIQRLSRMSREDRDVVIELTDKMTSIQLEAQKVKNSDLSKQDKQVQMDRLKLEFKRANDKINEINTSGRVRQDGFYKLSKEEQSKRIEAVEKEVTETTGEKPSRLDAEFKAVLDFNKEQYKSDIYYYLPEAGESKPETLPEGYTSSKEVSNSKEVESWILQNMKDSKTVSELEAIKPSERTDFEQAELTLRNVADVMHKRGFLGHEIRIVQAVLKAKAEASGKGLAWFKENASQNGSIDNIMKYFEEGSATVDFLSMAETRQIPDELAREIENSLSEKDKADILEWTGGESWNAEALDGFKEAVQKYLFEGKSPTQKTRPILERIKNTVKGIYENLKNTDVELDIPKSEVLDSMFKTEAEITDLAAKKELYLQKVNITALEAKAMDIFLELKKANLIKEIPC